MRLWRNKKKIREMLLHDAGSPRLQASGTFGSKDILEVRSLVNNNKKEKNADQDESPLVQEDENEKYFCSVSPIPLLHIKTLGESKRRRFVLEAVKSRALDAAGILSLSLLLNVFSFCLRGTKGM